MLYYEQPHFQAITTLVVQRFRVQQPSCLFLGELNNYGFCCYLSLKNKHSKHGGDSPTLKSLNQDSILNRNE